MPNKRRMSSKQVIVGVFVLLLTGMVVAGVVVSLKLFLDTTKDIVKVGCFARIFQTGLKWLMVSDMNDSYTGSDD